MIITFFILNEHISFYTLLKSCIVFIIVAFSVPNSSSGNIPHISMALTFLLLALYNKSQGIYYKRNSDMFPEEETDQN